MWFSSKTTSEFGGARAVAWYFIPVPSPVLEWPDVGVDFTGPVCAFLRNPRKGRNYQFEREFLIFSKEAVRLL